MPTTSHRKGSAVPTVIGRKEARLALPKKFSGWMRLPAPEVWIHHTVTGTYDGDPAAGMRDIQRIAFSRGFNDISYSWLVFMDGTVGEGRGWGVVGAHTLNHNSKSHAIVCVGNFETRQPSAEMMASIAWIIDTGIAAGKISPPRNRRPDGGHRDVPGASTACPGINVYQRIPSLRGGNNLPPPAPPQTPNLGRVNVNVSMPVLKAGTHGPHVSSLQSLLNHKAGQGLVADGDFGPATTKAVKNFQRFFKLGDDGIVGTKTWEALLVIPL